MPGLALIPILVTGSGHIEELNLPFYSSGRYESASIWQYGLVLPRVFCTMSAVPWFDYSPLGESVTAGMECILGSAMYLKSTGMSLKKAQSTVSILEDGLNTRWESNLRSPEAKAQKRNIHKAVVCLPFKLPSQTRLLLKRKVLQWKSRQDHHYSYSM